jgi:predicted O-linked N-acetylglucosamine transferase (SPINDLY family)
VGRAGLSILSNLGLSEFVAKTAEEYVHLASNLANDLRRLTELRASLRSTMKSSPLMNGPEFARGIELSYRWMWNQWCK